MNTILSRAGFSKRSGAPISEVIFNLMLWLWLKKESIGMFARECLLEGMGKDVLYDTMNREDLDWRTYHRQIADKTVRTLKASGKKAYVVDQGSLIKILELTHRLIGHCPIRLLCAYV